MYTAAQKETGFVIPVLLVIFVFAIGGGVFWFMKRPDTTITNTHSATPTAMPTATVEPTEAATASAGSHPQLQSKPPIPRLKSISQ